MTSALRTSENGLKLIMAYEGFRSHSSQLPDGRWVIGYGHLRAARAGLKVSQPEAAAILREFDLPPIEAALHEMVLVPLNQHEFDALASFAFNIGIDQFEASDVLSTLNSGDRMAAARALERWCNARVGPRNMMVDPLVRRRADEKALFLKTVGTVPLAASSRFRPSPDLPDEAKRPAFNVTEASAAVQDDTSLTETATETAARTVKERLTRILGEIEGSAGRLDNEANPADPAAEDQAVQEASVEEIRAAISALVAEDDEPSASDIGLDEIDLDGEPARNADRSDSTGMRLPRRPGLYIDDVKDYDAARVRPYHRREKDSGNGAETVVFAVIALLGAMMFLLGGAFGLGWFGITLPGQADDYGYLPPFLMLTGALVFLVMIYYWTRALILRR